MHNVFDRERPERLIVISRAVRISVLLFVPISRDDRATPSSGACLLMPSAEAPEWLAFGMLLPYMAIDMNIIQATIQ